MEAGRARGYRDNNSRLPILSLGLTSVRLIVNKLESKYSRVGSDANDSHCELVKYDSNADEGYEDYDDSPLYHSRGRVWDRFAVNLGVALSKCIPRVSLGNIGILAVVTGLFAPKMISYLVVYPFCRLVFGTLYPAYASYKAVRTKNLKEYVKWMMYWIVFALFTCTETFTDVFLSWFPFYYEVKIVLVLWLLSPATKGSSILYRKFVHPALCRREQEIDEYIAKAKDQGYHTVLNLGTKGVNYATTVIMQTAIKGGGGLVQQLRKSYSLSDLSECEPRDERAGAGAASDEAADVLSEPRLIRRAANSGFTPRRSASESNSRSPLYFPEVDVDVRARPARPDEPDFSHIKSTEDISSGYSSADNSGSLSRAASVGGRRARPARTAITTIKRPQAAEESEVITEELHDVDNFEYANMPPLVNLPSPLFLSPTDPPFLYQYVGDEIKIIRVLGNYPLSADSNFKNNNSDNWDQNEKRVKEASLRNSVNKEQMKEDHKVSETDKNNGNKTNADVGISVLSKENDDGSDTYSECIVDELIETNKKSDSNPFFYIEEKLCESIADINKEDERIDIASVDASVKDNYSGESDDEASFGTPDNSPKSKRRSSKGKYGKEKAPPPPIFDYNEVKSEHIETDNKSLCTTSQESLADYVNKLPNLTLRESTTIKTHQVINPIAEKKRRHKSPGQALKGSSSGIGRLLQLPSKLVFWSKTDEKSKSDDMSTSSEDLSSKLSIGEKQMLADVQCLTDMNAITSLQYNTSNIAQMRISDDEVSFKDASEIDNEIITKDIMDKSETLQKLIDAKLESHPEYKYVVLHEEIPTTSKSTDV